MNQPVNGDPIVLLVDDDERTLHLVSSYLRREGYGVATATNGFEALRLARDLLPSLVVLDLMLPRLSGLEVCRTLRQEANPFVIMLTAKTTEEDKLIGLDSGADDYVSKPFSPRELTARVRAVLRRGGGFSPSPEEEEVVVGEVVLDLRLRSVAVRGKTMVITPVEFRILLLLMRNLGKVFTREELIERVFGYDYEGLDRTVDAHIKNLRRKIESNRSDPRYIRTRFGVGYFFDGAGQ